MIGAGHLSAAAREFAGSTRVCEVGVVALRFAMSADEVIFDDSLFADFNSLK